MKYPFNNAASLVRFDIFTTSIGGEVFTYYCRATVDVYGLNEDNIPVGQDGQPLTALSTQSWTPEEEADIEAMAQAYARSMSCEE